MPILGMNYTRIMAERKKPIAKNTKISTGPKIRDVRKSKIQGLGNDVESLSIGFSFTSEIEPEVGKIDIEGMIIYRSDNQEEIMTLWNEKKTIPDRNQAEIFNHLFKKTGILALQLSDTLQFPPIISMPTVTVGKPPKKE